MPKFAGTVKSVLALFALGCALSLPARAEVPLLFVVQDESSIEAYLKTYLQDRFDWDIETKIASSDASDEYLKIPFNFDGVNVPVYVDTLVAGRDDDGKVVERAVQIKGYLITEIPEGDDRRLEFLELINTLTRKYWAPQRFTVDSDGDIWYEWHINITRKDAPVHAEQISDAVQRTVNVVRDNLIPELKQRGWLQ